jgi:hypothetical protein
VLLCSFSPLSSPRAQDVKGVGQVGDKVQVKHGFGRNYLIPEGFAVYATPENRELVYVKHGIDAEEAERKAREEAAAGSTVEASTTKTPYFDAGANIMQRLNWRFRRLPRDAKSGDLTVRNPITKADVVTLLRDAKFHHITADDVAFPTGVEAFDTYGAYKFSVRYHAPDTVAWVPITSAVFPMVDTSMEATKSLLNKERDTRRTSLEELEQQRILARANRDKGPVFTGAGERIRFGPGDRGSSTGSSAGSA